MLIVKVFYALFQILIFNENINSYISIPLCDDSVVKLINEQLVRQ